MKNLPAPDQFIKASYDTQPSVAKQRNKVNIELGMEENSLANCICEQVKPLAILKRHCKLTLRKGSGRSLVSLKQCVQERQQDVSKPNKIAKCFTHRAKVVQTCSDRVYDTGKLTSQERQSDTSSNRAHARRKFCCET